MATQQAISVRAQRRSRIWIALALATAVGGMFFFIWIRPEVLAKSASEGALNSESTLVLETFVVNLKGDERAYLRAGITLALSHPLAKDQNASGTSVALIRDTILDALSREHPQQLLQPEGKRELKTEILAALNQRAPELGVKDVYFTEFLVQM
jgi:flagellar protein FliL